MIARKDIAALNASAATLFFTCSKVIGRIVVVAACGLLPACAASVKAPDEAYAKEAWTYFKKKCETEAGEKIYKTYTGVKSVLVVKPASLSGTARSHCASRGVLTRSF